MYDRPSLTRSANKNAGGRRATPVEGTRRLLYLVRLKRDALQLARLLIFELFPLRPLDKGHTRLRSPDNALLSSFPEKGE